MKPRPCVGLALASLAVGVGAAFAATDSPVPAAPRRAFVTSLTYNGNLGGLAGADAKCQARADAAGLITDTSFVAFISTSTTDAYCHVQGLSGKRSANCGEAELPANAGPWVRVDGFPFAARIDLALSPTNSVLAPPNLYETGAWAAAAQGPWTGSDPNGEVLVAYPVPCGDWTLADLAQLASGGASWATAETWIISGNPNCSGSRALLCLETGPASPLPAHRSGGALAFVTSVAGTGDLGSWPDAGEATGLEAGDAICRARATAAGLPAPDTFFAWLSSGSITAPERLTLDGPWIRPDGVLIAAAQSDLLDGTLHAPINLTETGVYLGSYAVWTGTTAAGAADGARCGDWTLADSSNGRAGWANYASSYWTVKQLSPCSSTYLRLYCLSDFPAVVFVDDFESADCAAWSLEVPGP